MADCYGTLVKRLRRGIGLRRAGSLHDATPTDKPARLIIRLLHISVCLNQLNHSLCMRQQHTLDTAGMIFHRDALIPLYLYNLYRPNQHKMKLYISGFKGGTGLLHHSKPFKIFLMEFRLTFFKDGRSVVPRWYRGHNCRLEWVDCMGGWRGSAGTNVGKIGPLCLELALLLPPSLGEEGPMPARAQKRKYTPSHISISN